VLTALAGLESTESVTRVAVTRVPDDVWPRVAAHFTPSDRLRGWDPCAKTMLTRDVGRDETRPPHVPRIARQHTGSRADRAPTTRDTRHSEGNHPNYQSSYEALRMPSADADQPHRIA
jgi:hypothetical protein